MSRAPRTESGFVLPTAIFLLVILAALGGYMVSLSRTSHLSSALDIQGARAYQAARAGIEWAAWQAVMSAGRSRAPRQALGFMPPVSPKNTLVFPSGCRNTLKNLRRLLPLSLSQKYKCILLHLLLIMMLLFVRKAVFGEVRMIYCRRTRPRWEWIKRRGSQR